MDLFSAQASPMNQKVECKVCGKLITKGNIGRHQKSLNCNPKCQRSKELLKKENAECKTLVSNDSILENKKDSGCDMSVKKCAYCEEAIEGKLQRHQKSCKYFYKFTRKSPTGYECMLCYFSCSMRSNLYIHLEETHKISKTHKNAFQAIECNFCKELITLSTIIKHVTDCKYYHQFMKKTSDGYECTFCSITHIRMGDLYSHIKQEHKINTQSEKKHNMKMKKTVKCEICNEFVSKANILRHQKGFKCHVSMKKCPYCEEVLKNTNSSRHTNTCKFFFKYVKISPIGYECTVCSSNYHKRTNLYIHLRDTHKIKKPLDDLMMRKCQFCQDKINLNTIGKHEYSCKTFYQFVKKTPDGYKCTFCSSIHSKRGNLHKHLEEKHNIKRTINASQVAKCAFCQEMINLNSIRRHTNVCKLYYKFVKKTSDGYVCTVCSSDFSKRGSLIVHLEEKHKIKKPIDDIMTRKCKFCQDKINLNTISKHENSCKTFYQFMKKTLDGYKCNICSSVHSKRSSLHKHLEEKHKITRTIDASQVAKCDFCQEMINLNSISRHRDICKNVFQVIKKVSDGYECTICSSTYSNRGILYVHLKEKHKMNESKDISKLAKCDFCKEMIYLGMISKHKSICKNFYQFMEKKSDGYYHCKMCLTNLLRRGNMYQHLEEKHDIKKQVVNSSNQKIEAQEKTYNGQSVETCNTIKDEENNPRDEMRPQPKYSKRKKLECIICGATVSKGNMSRHEKQHSIENRKQCEYCKEFIQLGNIQLHEESCQFMKKTLDGYECTFCSSRHSKRSNLLQHLKEKHSIARTINASQVANCDFCLEMIDLSVISKHKKFCILYGKFLKRSANAYECKICSSRIVRKGQMYAHIRKRHGNEVQNDAKMNNEESEEKENHPAEKVFKKSNNSKCMHCDEIIEENDFDSHSTKLCEDASNYVNGQKCLICDTEFELPTKAIKHVMANHLDIIQLSTVEVIPSENIVGTEIKQEIMDTNTDSKNSYLKMDGFLKPEPIEITTLFKCPICSKKYLSYSDVETHMSVFHRIPLEVQKQSIQRGVSTAIIKENLK